MALNLKGGMFDQGDVRETITNTEETSVLFNLSYARFHERVDHSETLKGMCFSPTGHKMYITYDNAGASTIAEWTLATPWNINTATQTHTLDVDAKDTDIRDICVSPDGLKLFWVGHTNTNAYEYDMTTAWDLSTAVDSAESINVGANLPATSGITFREDGKEVYFGQDAGNEVATYVLTTAWDFSTEIFVSRDVAETADTLTFSRDGLKLFTVEGTGLVYIHTLTIPYLISSRTGNTTWTMVPDGDITGIFFKTNGDSFYTGTNDTEFVQEYHLHRKWRCI